MTAYEYRCQTCETNFDVRRGVTEDALPVSCPQGHDNVARVGSAVNVGGLPTVGAQASRLPFDDCCGEGCCG